MNKFQVSVIGAFFAIILLCAILVIYSDNLSATAGEELSRMASHGFTFSIGSAIGALVAMTGSKAFSK